MMKSKGYSKGGTRMMKAKKGKMAKGYAKGGAKMMKAKGGKMAAAREKGGRLSVSDLRVAAKLSGYNIVKAPTKKTPPGPALFTKKKK